MQNTESSADDIQRNLLRILAVTSGSWDLVHSSRVGRRIASRDMVKRPTRPAPGWERWGRLALHGARWSA